MNRFNNNKLLLLFPFFIPQHSTIKLTTPSPLLCLFKQNKSRYYTNQPRWINLITQDYLYYPTTTMTTTTSSSSHQPAQHPKNNILLENLRLKMNQLQLDALVITHSDAHQSEYLAPVDERLAFVSNFTGSAGTAIITLSEALLWTDGRYWEQAGNQLSSNWTLMKAGDSNTPSMESWLSDYATKTTKTNQLLLLRVGIDSKTCSVGFCATVGTRYIQLVALTPDDPIVELWGSARPSRPCFPIKSLPFSLTGCSVQDKLNMARKKMEENNVGLLVISTLDDICWALNLRGTDIPFNPVFFAHFIMREDGTQYLYCNQKQHCSVENKVLFEQLYEQDKILIRPYDDFLTSLGAQCRDSTEKKKRIWIGGFSDCSLSTLIAAVPDKERREMIIRYRLSNEVDILAEPNPFKLNKPVKTQQEINAMKHAQDLDAVALCRFLAYVELIATNSRNGIGISELEVEDGVEYFRQHSQEYLGNSFHTIAGMASNGAVIHYKASRDGTNNSTVRYGGPNHESTILLLDSGGHYPGGTTDTTRTVWVRGNNSTNSPTQEEKEAYTLVLKGHLALMDAIFPKGTSPHTLDVVARIPLWQKFKDYAHGTGHGVGCELCVHELPPLISKRCPEPGSALASTTGLSPGVVVTIEPGLYLTGKFGIRIENLVQVIGCENDEQGKFCSFANLTPVPYCRNLIDVGMLTKKEIYLVNKIVDDCLKVFDRFSNVNSNSSSSTNKRTRVDLNEEQQQQQSSNDGQLFDQLKDNMVREWIEMQKIVL
jgi:Xaa-Pro aminopeptidase